MDQLQIGNEVMAEKLRVAREKHRILQDKLQKLLEGGSYTLEELQALSMESSQLNVEIDEMDQLGRNTETKQEELIVANEEEDGPPRQ